MAGRYIFFRGILDTLDLYTEEFVRIYQEAGAECLTLAADDMENEMLRLKAFLLSPVTAAISLNNVGLHLEFADGKNIWDSFHIPFFNILMDHPFHYKKMLETAPEQMILLCMDENHMAYVRRFFPNIRRMAFFPHAGIAQEKEIIPIKNRKIEVFYAGSLSRYAAEGLIPDLGKIRAFDAFLLVKRALEQLVAEPEQTVEDVICGQLTEQGLALDDPALGELIAELRFLEAFAVSFYREQAVRLLIRNKIPVTVFGSGWDRCEWAQDPYFFYGGEAPPRQVLELMGQSKIVLNTMTWFKRGAHDRIFNGMLAGAAVVTDVSAYMERHFTDGKELRMFALKNIAALPQIVSELLEPGSRAQEIADCGYEAARAGHMWKNRIKAIDDMTGEERA